MIKRETLIKADNEFPARGNEEGNVTRGRRIEITLPRKYAPYSISTPREKSERKEEGAKEEENRLA